MKNKTLGIIMAIIGALIIVYTEFDYVPIDKAIDISSIQINNHNNHHEQLSPTVGIVLLVGGIIVFAIGKRAHKENGYLK